MIFWLLFYELTLLLEQVQFSAQRDTLWFAGDLVACGPKSLQTLRFAKSLGDSARIVLGKSRFHLLAVALGVRAKQRNQIKSRFLSGKRSGDELLNWPRSNSRRCLEHDEFVLAPCGHFTHNGDLAYRSPNAHAKSGSRAAKRSTCHVLIEQRAGVHVNTPDLWSPRR